MSILARLSRGKINLVSDASYNAWQTSSRRYLNDSSMESRENVCMTDECVESA